MKIRSKFCNARPYILGQDFKVFTEQIKLCNTYWYDPHPSIHGAPGALIWKISVEVYYMKLDAISGNYRL